MVAYERACAAAGCLPYPLDDDLLAEQIEGFAVTFVEAGGSSSSINGYVYGLMKNLRLNGRPLDDARRARVTQTLVELSKAHPAVVIRAAPVTGEDCAALRAYLRPFAARRGAYAVQMLSILALARSLKMRVSEAMDLRWGGVSLDADPRMLRVFLPLRKNEKARVSAADVHVVAFDAIADADPRLSLSQHARLCGRTIRPYGSPLSATGETLFCPMSVNGVLSKSEPSAWVSGELRRLYRLAGLPPPPLLERRSSQGLRRGRATEELEAGVAPSDVMKNQWKSKSGFAPYDVRKQALAARIAGKISSARPHKVSSLPPTVRGERGTGGGSLTSAPPPAHHTPPGRTRGVAFRPLPGGPEAGRTRGVALRPLPGGSPREAGRTRSVASCPAWRLPSAGVARAGRGRIPLGRGAGRRSRIAAGPGAHPPPVCV